MLALPLPLTTSRRSGCWTAVSFSAAQSRFTSSWRPRSPTRPVAVNSTVAAADGEGVQLDRPVRERGAQYALAQEYTAFDLLDAQLIPGDLAVQPRICDRSIASQPQGELAIAGHCRAEQGDRPDGSTPAPPAPRPSAARRRPGPTCRRAETAASRRWPVHRGALPRTLALAVTTLRTARSASLTSLSPRARGSSSEVMTRSPFSRSISTAPSICSRPRSAQRPPRTRVDWRRGVCRAIRNRRASGMPVIDPDDASSPPAKRVSSRASWPPANATAVRPSTKCSAPISSCAG